MTMRARAVHKNITLPCIFIELSPLNLLFFIIDACPGHILESTQGIEMKLGLLINGSERKGLVQEPESYPVCLQSYRPLTLYLS